VKNEGANDMEIGREDRERIEKLIAGFKCPKNFKCYKTGLKSLCKSKDIGMEHFLECLEKSPKSCVFAVPFGGGHFCHCPLRVYIAKTLQK